MGKKRQVKSYFNCSCCGCGFYGYIDHQRTFDRDTGFGLCKECEQDQKDSYTRQIDRMIEMVKGSLTSPKVKADFIAKNWEDQETVVLQLMDKGCFNNFWKKLT